MLEGCGVAVSNEVPHNIAQWFILILTVRNMEILVQLMACPWL
jgi:hypothetical protein